MSESYKIDTTSNLFPAVGGHVFRLCAVFKEPIKKALLTKALESLQIDFPIIFSHLQRTFYSYIHVPAADLDIIDDGDPFIRVPDMLDTEKPSFRIHIKDELLSMDVFHGNADGKAAAAFLNALIRNYSLLLDGRELPAPVPPAAKDLKDPYPMYYKRTKASSFFEKEAYRVRLERPENPFVRFTCVSIDLKALKGVTKNLGVTVNDFLCAALYESIAASTDARDSELPVSISVSIDLRPFFGSETQRNFSYYTNVRISRDDAHDLESAAVHIHKKVREALKAEHLLSGIAAAHKTANNPFVRAVPRAVKELAIRKTYRHIAGSSITLTCSNLGFQSLPEEAAAHLERLEIYLGAGRGGLNTAATGFGDKVFFCFSTGSHDKSIEESFMKLLSSRSVPCSPAERTYEFKRNA